jgi:hypothetical protein
MQARHGRVLRTGPICFADNVVGIYKNIYRETSMDNTIKSAAIITAALLRNHANASTEKIAELMGQAMDAIELATSRQNSRNAQKHAELKKAVMIKR